jgi:hypothetical protein
MPIKIISGGLKEAPAKVSTNMRVPDYSEESLLGSGLRNVARLGARGLETGLGGVGSIADLFLKAGKTIEPYLQMPELGTESSLPERLPIPTTEDIRQHVTKPIEENFLPQGYLEPQGKAEEFLDYVGADLPYIALGGAGLGQKLIRSIGSSAGIMGAKEAGLGSVGQMAGGMIGGGLPGLLAKGRPSQVRKYGEQLRQQNYAKAEPIAKSTYFDGTNLKKGIEDLLEEASDHLNFDKKKEVINNLGKVYNEIPSGNLLINQAWKRKKDLNNLISNLRFDPKYDVARNYYKRAVGSLKGFLEEAGNKYPEFGKPYQSAEKLTMAVKSKPELISLFKKDSRLRQTVEKNKLAKAVLSTFGVLGPEIAGGLAGKVFGGTMGAGVGAGGMYLAKKGLDIYNLATTSPDLKKHLSDLMENATIGDRAAIASTIVRMNKDLEKLQKPKIKIISGGLK